MGGNFERLFTFLEYMDFGNEYVLEDGQTLYVDDCANIMMKTTTLVDGKWEHVPERDFCLNNMPFYDLVDKFDNEPDEKYESVRLAVAATRSLRRIGKGGYKQFEAKEIITVGII